MDCGAGTCSQSLALGGGISLLQRRTGDEISSLNAESVVIEALCKKTGIRLMYRTLGTSPWPEDWYSRKNKTVCCQDHQLIAATQSAHSSKTVVWSLPV